MSWVRAHKALVGYLWLALAVAVALYQVGPVAAREERDEDYQRCVDANQSRSDIVGAFAKLGDKFIEVSGGSQQAIDFKSDLLADLDLPQRPCRR